MKNNRDAVLGRQLNILQMVREKGEVRTEDMAEMFNTSLMTIRRDFQTLEGQKLIYRTHGGACSLDHAVKTGSDALNINYYRDRISEFASRYISDGDRIFINGSRTALNMLRYVGNRRVTVFTNNGWAIGESYPPGVTIRFSGGELRSRIMTGELAMRNLLEMEAVKAFIGCAAVYEDGEFRYDIPTEIGINEAMFARTKKDIYVLADHTKIRGKESDESQRYGSCMYDYPITLVTDSQADADAVKKLMRSGLKVVQVPG